MKVLLDKAYMAGRTHDPNRTRGDLRQIASGFSEWSLLPMDRFFGAAEKTLTSLGWYPRKWVHGTSTCFYRLHGDPWSHVPKLEGPGASMMGAVSWWQSRWSKQLHQGRSALSLASESPFHPMSILPMNQRQRTRGPFDAGFGIVRTVRTVQLPHAFPLLRAGVPVRGCRSERVVRTCSGRLWASNFFTDHPAGG